METLHSEVNVVTKARKLYLKAERLWKEYCFLRDGNDCQVQKYHPEVDIAHEGHLQVDHCITRANKHLYFDVKNGTVVCGSCNRAKGFKNMSVGRVIDQIVKDREGSYFEYMVGLDKRKHANTDWGKVWWLEDVVKTLEDKLADLRMGTLIQNGHYARD